MAKRTGSSARVEHAARRAVRKDVADEKATSAKGKKRPAPEAPKSTAHAKRVKVIATPPPKSRAHAKRSPKKVEASSRRGVVARAGSSRQKQDPAPWPKSAPAPQEPPLPPPGHASVLPPPRFPPPVLEPRSMELEWTGDPGGSSPPEEAALDRWVRRGDELLLRLAKHGAADHEYRVDLREGRFCWVDPSGRVSAEARARLLCTFVPQTASVMMGWADPRTRDLGLPGVPDMPAEVDDVDEEDAWRIAMAAAEHTDVEYLYRVRSPAQCMFLGLSALTFTPSRTELAKATPVAMVLATLSEARTAAELCAEPVDTLRARLSAAGATLLEQAEYAHRDTDWVARLVRTGKRLGALAELLPRPTFFSVAKGQSTMWLERELADDLVESIELLEQEWQQFA